MVHCVEDYLLDDPHIVIDIDFPETQEIAKVSKPYFNAYRQDST